MATRKLLLVSPIVTKPTSSYGSELAERGFAIVEDVLPLSTIEKLRTAINELPNGDEVRRKTNVYGVRNLFDISPRMLELAASTEIRRLVTPILGDDCFAVRATFFDKVPGANWSLRFHQDGVIAVKEQHETEGYSAWANKAGVTQVRPPTAILKNMLAIRVHLDDCRAENGALRVLAGSHTERWERDRLDECKSTFDEICCELRVGGILAMRPLAVHASSPADDPSHRRVIHIEFANCELDGNLAWQHRITRPTP